MSRWMMSGARSARRVLHARWARITLSGIFAYCLIASIPRACSCRVDGDADRDHALVATARKPLVLASGQVEQIATTDYVSTVGGLATNATPPTGAGDLETTTINGVAPGTVTSGTLTANTIAKATGASALANSSITDNGTTITFGATATTITEASGNLSGAGFASFTSGIYGKGSTVYMSSTATGILGFFFNTNAAATGKINAEGFNEGVTQFRSLEIDDGKGNEVAKFNGNTLVSTEFKGHVIANGAALSLAAGGGCGAGPACNSTTCNDIAGTFTTGAGTTTCVLTFANTYTSADDATCSVWPLGVATVPTYTNSATAITMSVALPSQKYGYHCWGH